MSMRASKHRRIHKQTHTHTHEHTHTHTFHMSSFPSTPLSLRVRSHIVTQVVKILDWPEGTDYAHVNEGLAYVVNSVLTIHSTKPCKEITYSQLCVQRHSAGHQKSVLIHKVSLYPKSHYVYSWKGLCSGHENSVVIRELSLYPQSLLAKLTVYKYLCKIT